MRLIIFLLSGAVWGAGQEKTQSPVPSPVAAFEYQLRDSASQQILFSNKSTNAEKYFWDFGDGTQSTELNPQHSYRNGGVFEVSLRATNNTAQDQSTRSVFVPVLLKADFVHSGGNCTAPCEVVFENRSLNAQNYLWDFGDGVQSKDKNPKHRYQKGGTYVVRLTANGKTGVARSEQSISIKDSLDAPLADFNVQNNNCSAPCRVRFINLSKNAEEYLWDFGNGNRTTVPSPEYEFRQAGIYNVQLTAKGKNGTDTNIKTVRIN